MVRIAILGNAGAGKSTLAADLAQNTGLPHIEVDRFLWQPDWTPAPAKTYDGEHDRAIAGEEWIIDGMGRWSSLQARLGRATHIVLLDLPFPLLERRIRARQAAWKAGQLALRPGGQAKPPDTEELLAFVRQIDAEWMPPLRTLVSAATSPVHHLRTAEDVDTWKASFAMQIAEDTRRQK